ncbi:hypothetical protein CAPTEDRAFT_201251 [Capitella teleta]|uniref:G-protein coupled receptors family 1 profile domain-containing protein n=1 Tax=Capitella teleta TaxID=283909 RepID=R7UVF3_CAPTE|nr:hypothetical protein CAPTEDRAFT_201251 [Capitella teleta]|eukprot:ELU10274.1 hypothetical protein CAPTEDRAFT_201251 [Capitella teleta]
MSFGHKLRNVHVVGIDMEIHILIPVNEMIISSRENSWFSAHDEKNSFGSKGKIQRDVLTEQLSSPGADKMVEQFIEDAVTDVLVTYGYPLVIVMGVICNALTLAVLQRPQFKRKTMRLTLSLLSVVDSLLLLVGLLRLWIIIVAAFDVRNVPLFMAMEIRRLNASSNATEECLVRQSWEGFMKDIMYWLDLALVTVPVLLILALNCFILWKLRKPNARLGRMTSTLNVTSSQTRMLLVLTFTFVLSILPLQLYFVVGRPWIWSEDEPHVIAQLKLAYSVCTFLFYWNSAANFFLYALSGSIFRRALLTLCHCCCSASSSVSGNPALRSDLSKRSQHKPSSTASPSFPDVVPFAITEFLPTEPPSESEYVCTYL